MTDNKRIRKCRITELVASTYTDNDNIELASYYHGRTGWVFVKASSSLNEHYQLLMNVTPAEELYLALKFNIIFTNE